VTNGGSHAPQVVPLFHDELLIGLVEHQRRERSRRFHLTQQIEFLGEGVTDTRGKVSFVGYIVSRLFFTHNVSS